MPGHRQPSLDFGDARVLDPPRSATNPLAGSMARSSPSASPAIVEAHEGDG